jgi:sugar phosphate permease
MPKRAPLTRGWLIVAALAITEPVSWGVLYYAFSVFLKPMQADLGWSSARLTGAFSVALLVAGIAAVPIGRLLDRGKSRLIMTVGSILSTLLILAWSNIESLPGLYLTFIGIGLAMAATFYEPAFALLARWFTRSRPLALTLLTFGGGWASVIFIPLSQQLIEVHGWRSALIRLAVIVGVITIPLHLLALRDWPGRGEPESPGSIRDNSATTQPLPTNLPVRSALRERPFWWMTLAFTLSMFVNVAITVHIIPILTERGFEAGFAAAAAGAIGLMAIPGRLIFTPLGIWVPRRFIPCFIFGSQALAMAELLWTNSKPGVWLFVVLFGIGFGAITPARASLVADLYGVLAFGTISGVLAFIVTFARAAAPLGASIIRQGSSSYDTLIALLGLLSAAAALAVLGARR